MQTLRGRTIIKNTPTDISQVRSNCGLSLNEGRRADSVADSKTSFNNPDATRTASEEAGQNLRVSVVFVRNQRGEPLMPCSPRKAKELLKLGEAVVVKRTPFAIQLTKPTGETKQSVKLGVDSGYKHVGLSAINESVEYISADVELRNDIVNLISEKRIYRKRRRSGKTRYRKPRFLNRGIKRGWLAPSIQHKVDSHLKIIKWIKSFLPITQINVEVAGFDIQKIKNPEIAGVEYQQGEQMDFWNTRQYVLYRDSHECQHCHGKSKDPILNVHHIESRKTGGDRPENLITLCKTCHDDYHAGKIELNVKRSKGFKAETFMSMVRAIIVHRIDAAYPDIKTGITFGYITKHDRLELGLPKSHVNDAFTIAGGVSQKRADEYFVKQVRRSNRKLFKGVRSHIKNTAPRFVHGFQRYDKVLYNGVECFIFARRITGKFDIRTLDGGKVRASASFRKLKLVEAFNTISIQRK